MAMRKIQIATALAGALATPAAAEKLEPRAMLVASTPARDSVVAAGTDTIELRFAEPAEVLSVSVRLPEDSEMTAEPEEQAMRGDRKTRFRFRLPQPLQQPGSYSLSYLLVSRSFKSLNGFVDFRIEGEPAPSAAEETAATEPMETEQ
ncbi:copper resistance protein CopC [Blastomonas sp. UPD001]|jgi:methionine-rich copper-binding protein CopC|uniref:copper resistance CopC family protein n=1 Tax=Blastomonas sp. UPD001 TaxID=2217673 RepID=UPI000E352F58|nr:copper resistance protein CopC [Blastomonas sp. UPD001]